MTNITHSQGALNVLSTFIMNSESSHREEDTKLSDECPATESGTGVRVDPFHLSQVGGVPAPSPSPAGSALAKSLGMIFTQRLEILREPIDEISEQISCREALSRALIQEIDQTIHHFTFMLRDLDTWALGHNDNIEHRRIALMESILALEKEKRSEKLRLWEDIVSLMQKRRDFLTEYKGFERFRALL